MKWFVMPHVEQVMQDVLRSKLGERIFYAMRRKLWMLQAAVVRCLWNSSDIREHMELIDRPTPLFVEDHPEPVGDGKSRNGKVLFNSPRVLERIADEAPSFRWEPGPILHRNVRSLLYVFNLGHDVCFDVLTHNYHAKLNSGEISYERLNQLYTVLYHDIFAFTRTDERGQVQEDFILEPPPGEIPHVPFVVNAVKEMYASRDFSGLPVMADALEDNNCVRTDLLNHLRATDGLHGRGCWAVDLLMTGSPVAHNHLRRGHRFRKTVSVRRNAK